MRTTTAAAEPTAGTVRQALTLDAIRWQYLHGVPDESVVSPDTWHHDFDLVSRPGNDRIQLSLFADYASNLPLYQYLQAYLRDSRVPLLAVWGRNDEIFGPDGARAFAADAHRAEIHDRALAGPDGAGGRARQRVRPGHRAGRA
jgi:pimeloyl-ACP methyl ester carboxylesterase